MVMNEYHRINGVRLVTYYENNTKHHILQTACITYAVTIRWSIFSDIMSEPKHNVHKYFSDMHDCCIQQKLVKNESIIMLVTTR